MNALIISYLPGMHGEFFAKKISNSEFFAQGTTTEDNTNRFYYPNFLGPIGKDVKNMTIDIGWNITEKEVGVLHSYYKEKWICLPTHWYNNLSLTNLPCKGIRLYAKNIKTLQLSYIMWWFKSHMKATVIWPDKEKEINQLLKTNPELKNFKNNFSNWKFMCYKFNLIKDGNPDLKKYIQFQYSKQLSNNFKEIQGYTRYPAEKICEFYPDYHQKNLDLLQERLNIKELKDDFLDLLHEYLIENLD